MEDLLMFPEEPLEEKELDSAYLSTPQINTTVQINTTLQIPPTIPHLVGVEMMVRQANYILYEHEQCKMNVFYKVFY